MACLAQYLPFSCRARGLPADKSHMAAKSDTQDGIVMVKMLTDIIDYQARKAEKRMPFFALLVSLAPLACLAAVIASAAVLIVTIVVAPVIAESPVEGIAAIASLATTIVGIGFLKVSFVP